MIIQGIGVAALLIAVSIYQTNTRKSMLLLGMFSCLLWSTHFFLLGAITGAAMNFISAIRCYVYNKIPPSKKNRWIMWSFIGILALATALTWQGVISLLPCVGSMSSVIASWQKRPTWMRRLGLLSSPPWFTYNLISGSYPGMVIEVLLVTSNLIGQYRFDFKPTFRSKLLRVARPT